MPGTRDGHRRASTAPTAVSLHRCVVLSQYALPPVCRTQIQAMAKPKAPVSMRAMWGTGMGVGVLLNRTTEPTKPRSSMRSIVAILRHASRRPTQINANVKRAISGGSIWSLPLRCARFVPSSSLYGCTLRSLALAPSKHTSVKLLYSAPPAVSLLLGRIRSVCPLWRAYRYCLRFIVGATAAICPA